MQVTEQFGLNAPLDRLFQLIHLSANFFSEFEKQTNLCFINLKSVTEMGISESERKQLLVYFLDLVQYFSHERLNLIQDPLNNDRLALSGGL